MAVGYLLATFVLHGHHYNSDLNLDFLPLLLLFSSSLLLVSFSSPYPSSNLLLPVYTTFVIRISVSGDIVLIVGSPN